MLFVQSACHALFMRDNVALCLGGRRRFAVEAPAVLLPLLRGVGCLLGCGGVVSSGRVSLVSARVRAAFVLPSGCTPVRQTELG